MKKNWNKKKDAKQSYLRLIKKTNEQGIFKPSWESLSQVKLPAWFDRERLGIFIHWGVYSVPAYANEWYPRNMYRMGTDEFDHHVKTYGPQSRFGYKEFIPMFRAEKFQPEEWISLFKAAGAGYICPVGEHHDGFQMYKSELSDWNSADMGPKRDVLGELCDAAARESMVFCTSSHRAEHWFFMGHGKEFDSDVRDPMEPGDFYWPAMPEPALEDWRSTPYPSGEYLEDWMARTAELIVKYRPKLLYFDWWIQHEAFQESLKEIAAFYYNMGRQWGEDVIICYKHDAMAFGSGLVDVERGGFQEPKPYRWQTDTAAARNSWCFTEDLDYKTGRDIIITLIDTVSKNGNLLLNVGPKADGTIPEGDRKILKELGEWMAVNREAICGSRPWRVSMEGPSNIAEGSFMEDVKVDYTPQDYRFTAKAGAVYAICLVCPGDGQFCIRSFACAEDPSEVGKSPAPFHGIVRKVTIPGFDKNILWKQTPKGLLVSAPGLESDYPVVIRIE